MAEKKKNTNSNTKSKREKQNVTPPSKRRVRTGCLTCRRKHKKCDENRNPKCDFCTQKGLACIWPEEIKNNTFFNNSFKDYQPYINANQNNHVLPGYLLKQAGPELNQQLLLNQQYKNLSGPSNINSRHHSLDYSDLTNNLQTSKLNNNQNNNNNNNNNSELSPFPKMEFDGINNTQNGITLATNANNSLTNPFSLTNSNSNSTTNLYNSLISSFSNVNYNFPSQTQNKRRMTDLGLYSSSGTVSSSIMNSNSLPSSSTSAMDSLSPSSSPFWGNGNTGSGSNKKLKENPNSGMGLGVGTGTSPLTGIFNNIPESMHEQAAPIFGGNIFDAATDSKIASPSNAMKVGIDPIQMAINMDITEFSTRDNSTSSNHIESVMGGSSTSSISSDISVKREAPDFEHRDSVMSMDNYQEKSMNANGLSNTNTSLINTFFNANFASAPEFYELNSTLADFISLITANKSQSLPNNETTFEFFTDKSSLEEPKLSSDDLVLLMSTFTDKISVILAGFNDDDSFDNNRNVFASDVVLLCNNEDNTNSKALEYAILALSSRYLEIIDDKYSYEKTFNLYNYSLHSLKNTLKDNNKLDDNDSLIIVVTCYILSVFELFSSKNDNVKKLKSVWKLFKHFKINGASQDIIKRNLFWSFVKFDIGYCSITDLNSTVVSYKDWFVINDDNEESMSDVTELTDMKKILSLVSQTIELSSSTMGEDTNHFNNTWKSIWQDLSNWNANKSNAMKAILNQKRSASECDSSFPQILYPSNNASIANQLYHMCCILMLQNKPRIFKFQNSGLSPSQVNDSITSNNSSPTSASASNSPELRKMFNCQSKSQIWHAKQIIGINLLTLSNKRIKTSRSQMMLRSNTDSLLSFSSLILQSILIAGRLITSSNEHNLVLGLLNDLEKSTGFTNSIGCKRKQLVEFWNSEC